MPERKIKNLDSSQISKLICVALGLSLLVTGFILDTPVSIFRGLFTYITSPDVLMSDYFVIHSTGAALVNAGIVTLMSVGLTLLVGCTYSGNTIAMIFLMAGFALFGKNPFNILPFFLGVWIYSKLKKKPMKNYIHAALFSTTLAPFVTEIFLRPPFPVAVNLLLSVAVGAFIGYIIIPIAGHSFAGHLGYNLFNYGFAGGLIALALTSVLRAFGSTVETADLWATGIPLSMIIYLSLLIAALIVIGLYFSNWSLRPLLALFKQTGRSPSDFVISNGIGPTLINMGLMGLLSVGYILLIGGDLNGPVVGAIFTSIGFGAAGEHPRNSIPVIGGVFFASMLITHDATLPTIQLAALFGTALAPLSGQFGAIFGVIAGFLHTCVVLAVGPLCGGYNLYNNGFAAGLVALIMIAVLRDTFPKKALPSPEAAAQPDAKLPEN